MAAAIPLDIIAKIFLCLPFESILTCKLVSKQWKDLINHPKFFKRYHTRSSLSLFFENKYSLYCLLIRHGNTNSNIGTVEGRRHPPFTVHRLPIDLAGGTKSERYKHFLLHHSLLSGSSNGIVCVLLMTGGFLVYNLFNGSSYTVADPPFPSQHSGFLCFGFGYDCNDDDYKIAAVVKNYDKDPTVRCEGSNSVVWVYSLKNLVWTPHKGFPDARNNSMCYKGACSFNGVLHWVVNGFQNKKKVIMTYDLHTCRFGEISIPDGYDSGLCSSLEAGIGELDGHLCYWDGYSKVDVWVMKEYGVGESWTHFICRKAFARWHYRITPTGIYECRNGSKGVLFASLYGKGSLYWCDIDNCNVKKIRESTWGKGRRKQNGKQDWEHIKKCFLG